jgi:hypothetical protein
MANRKCAVREHIGKRKSRNGKVPMKFFEALGHFIGWDLENFSKSQIIL